jgi:hypothetical protein
MWARWKDRSLAVYVRLIVVCGKKTEDKTDLE